MPPCCWTWCFAPSSTVPLSSCWCDTLVTDPSFPWCQVLLRGCMSCLALLSHHLARCLWRHLLNLVRIAARVTGRGEPALVRLPTLSLLSIWSTLVCRPVVLRSRLVQHCHCLCVGTSHWPCIGCAPVSSTGVAAHCQWQVPVLLHFTCMVPFVVGLRLQLLNGCRCCVSRALEPAVNPLVLVCSLQ